MAAHSASTCMGIGGGASSAPDPHSRPRLLPRRQRKRYIQQLHKKYKQLLLEDGGRFSKQHVEDFFDDIECLYDEGELTLPIPADWTIVQNGEEVDLLPPSSTDTTDDDDKGF